MAQFKIYTERAYCTRKPFEYRFTNGGCAYLRLRRICLRTVNGVPFCERFLDENEREERNREREGREEELKG